MQYGNWFGFSVVWVAMVLAPVVAIRAAAAQPPLPGEGNLPTHRDGQPIDWAWEMVEGLHAFLDAELSASVDRRAQHWNRDFTSREAYERSVAPNRRRLAEILGAADERVELDEQQHVYRTTYTSTDVVIHELRLPLFPGVEAELLLASTPGRQPSGLVIVLPDADQTPEALFGLTGDLPIERQVALRLAQSGFGVVAFDLIDRAIPWSRGEGGAAATEQPHREFIYRQAFEMGRHLIGYEVQQVRRVLDYVQAGQPATPPVAVFGYGEGGLVALAAAALDTRVDAVCVSGYFGPREGVWQEPIYRNVFGLLERFGDAELASLVAPRRLIVEAAHGPEIAGRELLFDRHSPTTPGDLTTPALDDVRREVERARQLTAGLENGDWLKLVVSQQGAGPFGSEEAIQSLIDALKPRATLAPPSEASWKTGGIPFGARTAETRRRHKFHQLMEYTQALMRESEYVRRETFWSRLDTSSLPAYQASTADFRRQFYDEVIGRFDQPLVPANPRWRVIYDEPAYIGYEVVLDVFPGVITYGHLLVPKEIQPGQRRPVVVCQHGLEGRPVQLTEPGSDHRAYHRFAGQLAERGYVTWSPQNPYIFFDKFRLLQRKLNPLGKTLYSIIVPQHQQAVDWLGALPFVDPERIGFYGLSYGGKTAMRVPPLVEGYCLSICSGDFNEWIWKNVSARSRYSYLHRQEYEIFEFNLGPTFNYAEMAALIAPRPFMVERGHRDGVAPDEQVAYEFAKVRRLYAQLGIPQRAEIEYFDGPHEVHCVGTFEFLDRHLGRAR